MAFPVLQAFVPVVGSYNGKYTLSLSIVGSAVNFLEFVRFTYQPCLDVGHEELVQYWTVFLLIC